MESASMLKGGSDRQHLAKEQASHICGQFTAFAKVAMNKAIVFSFFDHEALSFIVSLEAPPTVPKFAPTSFFARLSPSHYD